MTDPVVLLSTGDVVGPNSATSGTMVLFDGTSGKKIKGNNAVVTAQGLALLDDVDAAANRATIGLNQVNNTSDLNKPVSTAQQAALNTKADKATTLAGYNITDAIPNVNNLGSVGFDLHGSQLAMVTAANEVYMCRNAYWDGSWKQHDPAQPSSALYINTSGTPGILRALAGASGGFWTYNQRIMAEDFTYTRADVNGLVTTINNTLAGKADKATTLAGYNITDGLPNLVPSTGNNYTLKGNQYVFTTATNIVHMCQNAVWDGGQWNRLNTALGGIVVLAMNGQLYVQPFAAGANPLVFPNTYPVINSSNVATEGAAGVIPVAAQTWVDAGNDDSAAVTPKKLRWGVSMSLTTIGHLALPSWLGGVIFNWGRTQVAANGQRITFSKAYPTEVFMFLAGTGVDNSGQAEVMNPALNSLSLTGVNVNATQATEYPWFSVGK
ncbi:hypothetical protein QDY63_14815 [Pseudomonas brenneri]|uniref:gp53-like domain-containing protein n=1 Tax=Pseudomonas brenneri TaxID=129817 RepID=UPI0025A0937D|nr:hypothetical protein [Pseudomonas brenneri]WJM94086.1 hypothetical protein QDY63_14815 [Pseudomonas brenneri]